MSDLDLAELRHVAEAMSKAPVGASGVPETGQDIAWYGLVLSRDAAEIATELPENMIALIDRLENAERELALYAAQDEVFDYRPREFELEPTEQDRREQQARENDGWA